MTDRVRDPDRRFVRAIESAWMALAGRPVVVSPRDFETLASWHGRGIPLRVILQAIEEWGKAHRGRRPPATLRAFASRVETAWDAVRDGRAAAAAPSAQAPGPPPLQIWESVRRAAASAELAALLGEAIAAARDGRDAAEVDGLLDRGLPELAGEALVRAAERASSEALAPYRSRMSPEAFRTTWERARADRLRSALGLPRLAPSIGSE